MWIFGSEVAFALGDGEPFASLLIWPTRSELRSRRMACPGGNSGTSERRSERKMIRKLKSGEYRLYSRKKNPGTGRRRNLGTFATRAAAEKHERAVQYFKRGGRGR